MEAWCTSGQFSRRPAQSIDPELSEFRSVHVTFGHIRKIFRICVVLSDIEYQFARALEPEYGGSAMNTAGLTRLAAPGVRNGRPAVTDMQGCQFINKLWTSCCMASGWTNFVIDASFKMSSTASVPVPDVVGCNGHLIVFDRPCDH
jgi:hypothetical protein